jgi:hypothetical protein
MNKAFFSAVSLVTLVAFSTVAEAAPAEPEVQLAFADLT